MCTRENIVVGVLLTVYLVLTVTASLDKCNTYDELAHLTAGYSYWLEGDYRLQPENGNWPQRWGALPLLVSRPAFPSTRQETWYKADIWNFGREFFFELGNDPAQLLLQGRAMIALVGVALALLVYLYARSLFGVPGAMLSLLLCVFCPTLLAHGGLITSDVAAGLFFLAVIWTFWRLLHDVNVRSLFLSGLALGGLFLSKFSAVIIVPALLLMGLVRLVNGRELVITFGPRRIVTNRVLIALTFSGIALCQVVLVWSLIWLSFGFRSATFTAGDVQQQLYPGGWDFVLDDHEPWSRETLLWARDNAVLPESYLYGFAFTLRYAQHRSAFLNGERSFDGWPWFFPYAFLVKTPLATLGILLVALLSIRVPLRQGTWKEAWQRWYDFVPLWIFLLVFWTFAIKSHLNIGQRHILPAYPVFYILAGAAMSWWHADVWKVASNWKSAVAASLLQFCLCWLMVETLWRWPHYLAYFNQVVGGPSKGYQHLVDSSLDWGQDLPGLKKWLDRHRAAEPAYLDYFGSADPSYYVPGVKLLPISVPALPDKVHDMQPGIFCISATNLQSVYDDPWNGAAEKKYRALRSALAKYDTPGLEREGNERIWLHVFYEYHQLSLQRLRLYLRNKQPDDNVGYSILIYRLSESDLKQALGS